MDTSEQDGPDTAPSSPSEMRARRKWAPRAVPAGAAIMIFGYMWAGPPWDAFLMAFGIGLGVSGLYSWWLSSSRLGSARYKDAVLKDPLELLPTVFFVGVLIGMLVML